METEAEINDDPGVMSMRLLVCGGRDYKDYGKVHKVLTKIDKERGPITFLIQGGATGADSEAFMWGVMVNNIMRICNVPRRIKHLPFPIKKQDWDKYGKAAGRIRNQQMLDEGKPDLVVAFPGNSGTANMIEISKKAGIEVIVVKDNQS